MTTPRPWTARRNPIPPRARPRSGRGSPRRKPPPLGSATAPRARSRRPHGSRRCRVSAPGPSRPRARPGVTKVRGPDQVFSRYRSQTERKAGDPAGSRRHRSSPLKKLVRRPQAADSASPPLRGGVSLPEACGSLRSLGSAQARCAGRFLRDFRHALASSLISRRNSLPHRPPGLLLRCRSLTGTTCLPAKKR